MDRTHASGWRVTPHRHRVAPERFQFARQTSTNRTRRSPFQCRSPTEAPTAWPAPPTRRYGRPTTFILISRPCDQRVRNVPNPAANTRRGRSPRRVRHEGAGPSPALAYTLNRDQASAIPVNPSKQFLPVDTQMTSSTSFRRLVRVLDVDGESARHVRAPWQLRISRVATSIGAAVRPHTNT